MGSAAAVAFAGTALGADRVVMPYRCQANGREIILTPSEARQYDIYGKREQDIVTACAPDNPNRCRTWRLHRFDMNCGGTRVPWIDVVASANTLTRGPAKVRNGQLYIRMDPWWSRQRPPAWAGRPALREFGEDDTRPDNFRSPSASRAPSVEMPPGFAPVVGMTAQFIAGPPGAEDARQGQEGGAYAERGSNEKWDYGTPGERSAGVQPQSVPGQVPAPVPSEKLRPLPDAAPKSAGPAATPPFTPSTTAPTTSTRDPGHTFAPKMAEAKPAEPKPAVPADLPVEKALDKKEATAPVIAPAPAVAAAPGTGVAPTINSVAPVILNRPGAETTAITSATSSSGDKSGTDVAGASGDAIPATLESAPKSEPLMAPLSRNGPILLGVVALALLGAAGAYYMRHRGESSGSTRTAERDLSAVSLDAVPSRALVPTAPAQQTPPVSERSPSEPPPLTQSLAHALMTKAPPVATFVTGPVAEPEWIPATREEALHVLGAGPDASEAVLKKIVDGLRMSWHPDHAKTAGDHRLRSERMTQINVAWDILTGRQAVSGSQV